MAEQNGGGVDNKELRQVWGRVAWVNPMSVSGGH